MKHLTPRRPLAIVLILAFALGIASSGCAISWPWSQPSQETLSRTPVPTDIAAAEAGAQTPNAEAATFVSVTPDPTLAPIELRATEEQAQIRVLLKSLEAPVALGMTVTGPYSIENDSGFRFEADSYISVAAQGENLYLSCGGMTINMGTSLTLTRAASDDPYSGIVIYETGRENIYCGDLTLTNDRGVIMPVLTVDVEDYLYGVVPYEMSDSFPVEALKAQAVAARTYAMSRKSAAKGRAYDLVDTPGDQVYRGVDPDTENAIRAVNETRGVVGFYKGDYATCYFSASNGGQTAMPDQIWGYPGDYGYLDVRDDPYDLANPSSVVRTLNLHADGAWLPLRIAKALKSGLSEQMAALGCSEELSDIGIVKLLSVVPAAPKFGEGNRMFTRLDITMQVRAKKFTQLSEAEAAVSSATYRSDVVVLDQPLTASLDIYGDLKPNSGLEINAADCEVTSVRENKDALGNFTSFDVETRRYGHGIGLSQRGAQQMAGANGFTWRQILDFYYPGMTLLEMDYARSPLVALDALPGNLGRARPRPTPKPTPGPLPALAPNEYYARVALGSKSSTLNVRSEPSTGASIKGIIDHGARLIVMEELDNGWARIKTAELSGYASMDYIKKES